MTACSIYLLICLFLQFYTASTLTHLFYSSSSCIFNTITHLYQLATKTSNPHFQNDEITYAELSLTNQQMPHVIYNQQAIPMSVIRRQEPTVYAQLDMTKRVPQCLQPLSPPLQQSFQTLHHPHLPAYMPRSIREEQIVHDGNVNAETPLLNPREGTVSIFLFLSEDL